MSFVYEIAPDPAGLGRDDNNTDVKLLNVSKVALSANAPLTAGLKKVTLRVNDVAGNRLGYHYLQFTVTEALLAEFDLGTLTGVPPTGPYNQVISQCFITNTSADPATLDAKLGSDVFADDEFRIYDEYNTLKQTITGTVNTGGMTHIIPAGATWRIDTYNGATGGGNSNGIIELTATSNLSGTVFVGVEIDEILSNHIDFSSGFCWSDDFEGN